MAERVAGWLLHPEDRDCLLAVFPPAYREVVAHHVTLESRVPPDFPLPSETEGFVAGVADDGAGVQASWSRSAARRGGRTVPPTTSRSRLRRAGRRWGTTERSDGSTYTSVVARRAAAPA
jgi:hypothetical protein